jgi:hypothetical protein
VAADSNYVTASHATPNTSVRGATKTDLMIRYWHRIALVSTYWLDVQQVAVLATMEAVLIEEAPGW